MGRNFQLYSLPAPLVREDPDGDRAVADRVCGLFGDAFLAGHGGGKALQGNSLSAGGRVAIEQTCGDNVRFSLTRADALQFEALKTLGLAGVQIRRWPDPILDALENTWTDAQREYSKNDKDFAQIWKSLQKFRQDYAIWRDLSRP